MAGSTEGLCPLCIAVVCSQVHILCECPTQDSYRREQLVSIPTGPQLALVLKFVDFALNGTPVDERVLLCTGMPNNMQRGRLHTFILLPVHQPSYGLHHRSPLSLDHEQPRHLLFDYCTERKKSSYDLGKASLRFC